MDEGDYRVGHHPAEGSRPAGAGELRGAPRPGHLLRAEGLLRRGRARLRARRAALNADDLLLNYNLAALYALWGRRAGRARVPEEGAWRRTARRSPGWLATDPMFDALKGDPEFESLLLSADSAWNGSSSGWRCCWSSPTASSSRPSSRIVKIRPTRLQALADEGSPGAAQRAEDGGEAGRLPVRHASSASRSRRWGWAGWVSRRSPHLLEPVLDAARAGQRRGRALAHTVALAIAFAIITFLHIVVGELAPKSLAIQRAEATTLAVALPDAGLLLRLLPGHLAAQRDGAAGAAGCSGCTPRSEAHEAHSEEELRVILAQLRRRRAPSPPRARSCSSARWRWRRRRRAR